MSYIVDENTKVLVQGITGHQGSFHLGPVTLYSLHLSGAKIRDLKVTKVLVEDMINIKHEYYVSIALNRSERKPVLIASPSGGVEIEAVPDDKLIRKNIDPLLGYSSFITKELSSFMQFDKDLSAQFDSILRRMYKLFNEYDCELVEINPLVLTAEGKLIAADSKVVVDNDSLFRHKDLSLEDPEKTPLEKEAQEKGYAFVELDGKIGVIANGAGLTMATLDALTLHNGKPRNFLDLGGTDSTEIVVNAFDLVLKAKPQAILVNIFGGVTKCDTVAAGLSSSGFLANLIPPDFPLPPRRICDFTTTGLLKGLTSLILETTYPPGMGIP